ncbi:DUF2529 domain-containing protein [Neobacillus mesonae]|uniref:DUF2529 domain-containing protein n=1 Tax=Neobacillus mesonae TaxID=1193713 RepID=UPI002E1BBBD3|nr:DUF2529 domain-containing protein [Neobacillus mesonae]
MLKMFTTQLTGLFKKIADNEDFSFEDGARLLAQAAAGNGSIYLFGVGEMKAVEFESLEGAEPLQSAKVLDLAAISELTDADRVVLFARSSTDEDALQAAQMLQEKNIPFVGVSTAMSEGGLSEMADVYIDLGLKKGLIPDDFGGRIGYPSSMAGLFAYYGLKFTIDEILAEYEI